VLFFLYNDGNREQGAPFEVSFVRHSGQHFGWVKNPLPPSGRFRGVDPPANKV
jgi:hypothetical protein